MIALVCVQGVAILTASIGLLFVVGNLYRQLKRLLCHRSERSDDSHLMSISSPSTSYQRPQVIAATGL